jgi:hypothetical protein
VLGHYLFVLSSVVEKSFEDARGRESRTGMCGMSEAEEDFFEMANLFPADTGLPMVVWVSEHARHDVRVKVNQSHGTRMLPGNLAVVTVRPTPRLVAGNLSPRDLNAVSDWILLREAALVDYWEYRISTAQLIDRLRRLPTSAAHP